MYLNPSCECRTEPYKDKDLYVYLKRFREIVEEKPFYLLLFKTAIEFTVDSGELTELHQTTEQLEIELETVFFGSPLNSLQHDLKAAKKGDNVSNSQTYSTMTILNQDGHHTFKIVHIPKAESRYPSHYNNSSRFLLFFCDIKRTAFECIEEAASLNW
uniref:Uncharacterized protein n=1 Tax=Glossina palpalis gambiensis TaxID=67801 RepID=A0A1B0BK66_9MUSC